MPIGYTCSAAVCVWWSVDTSAYICSVLRQLPGIRGCGLCYAGYCVRSGSFPDSGGSLVSPWAHGMNRYVCVPILAHALRGNTLPPWWLRFKVPPGRITLVVDLKDLEAARIIIGASYVRRVSFDIRPDHPDRLARVACRLAVCCKSVRIVRLGTRLSSSYYSIVVNSCGPP
jgi:hypothetical protein